MSQVGTGEPSPSSPYYQWVDPEGPIPDIRHVGLSSWDSYVSYRCIQVCAQGCVRVCMCACGAVGMEKV